jgi:type II secretory pathway component PulJ
MDEEISGFGTLLGFVVAVVLMAMLLVKHMNLLSENERLKTMVATPETCASICAEEFEKYGC